MTFHSAKPKYSFYDASSEPAVYAMHQKSSVGLWRWLTTDLTSSQRMHCVSPFRKSCTGISTRQEYQLQLSVIEVDRSRVWCLITGLALFLVAASLSRSVLLYYLVGTSLGVLASILLILMLLSRLFPGKYAVLTVSLAAGSSLTIWLLRAVWFNLAFLLDSYRDYVVGYLLTSALFSFAVCYVRGPITNERLLDVIQWLIQAAGLVLIYHGTQVPALSTSIVVFLIGFQFLRTLCCSRNKDKTD